ncbi:hypothetical protein OS493_036741 [Desmophyllum pertusum]|uniref:SUEL-type lectin domain-containing protein n=1 Tax=Desmophyllum pertusum TaxID=174260 RepID=A0A9X0CU48_9CNID|nr:hypothetical protein OS493_036741 [Desmophyllum pertusum]
MATSCLIYPVIAVLVILDVGLTYVQGGVHSQDAGAGLSQIDLESSKEITVCTTQKKPLSCSYPGSNIAVTGVFWGRKSGAICPSDDGDTQLDCFTAPESEGIVKGRCEGKESCELEARHALLQNPGAQHCPGVNKYLTINYTCVPDAKEVVICDSENSSLTCPASWKIGVNSVFWGRQATTVCPAENGQSMCTGAPESLGIVKKSCDGLTKCDVHGSYDQVQNGAENCPGVQKYLIINYSCKPHPNIETEEDAIQNADQEPTTIIKIEKAPAEEGNNVVGENLNIGRLEETTTAWWNRESFNSASEERTEIFAKLPQAVKRKGLPVPFPPKLGAQRKAIRNVPTPVQVGVPKLQKVGLNGKGASSGNQDQEKKTVNGGKGSTLNQTVPGPAKMRPAIPVLKSQPEKRNPCSLQNFVA